MTPLEKFEALKDRVESLQRKADRSRGALDQLMARLKEEHGVGSLKEAKDELARIAAAKEKKSRLLAKGMLEAEAEIDDEGGTDA